MGQLISTFWAILRLRLGPQAVPASGFLYWSVIGLHLVTGIMLAGLSMSLGQALLSAFVGTAMVIAVPDTILLLRGLSHRRTQTVTALAGAEVIIGLAALPVTAWFLMSTGEGQAIPALISLFLVGWNVAVAAHVLSHALEVPKGLGVVAALIYMAISIIIGNVISG